MNPLQQLSQLGQSVWLDSLDRDLLESGRLQRLVEQDGLKGVTSNPTIFEQAISGSEHTLPAVLRALEQNPSAAAEQVYEELAVADIQRACDILRPVYAQTQCRDGYVSLEVSPRLARDAARTMTEGQRLWRRVARPNLMIKVPGTAECLPAIRGLISEGINVNVTLLFSITAYEQAAQATMQGLRDRLDAGNDIAHVVSVASFFISRIDTAVDKHLYTLAKQAAPEHKEQLHALLGKAAIANAKAAHAKRGKLHATPSWQELAGKGACPQRLLWAST
ncbi:MAG: transaldolase family protein, partial [Myxococcota bacterium]